MIKCGVKVIDKRNIYYMKKITLILIFLFSTGVFAQEIRTKDGISIGKRSEFIKECVESVNEEMQNIFGIQIDSYYLCACICDMLIPSLYSWEIMEAEKDEIIELFIKEANLDILMNCLEDHYEMIDDDFILESSFVTDQEKEEDIEECVEEYLNTPELRHLVPLENAHHFCQCIMDKLYSEGFTYKEIMEIDREDSRIHNEIIIPCFQEAMKEILEEATYNTYVPGDIKGRSEKSIIQLIDYLGSSYKIKIIIAGISRYYLFDTGATDIVIDREIERELLLNGIIRREDYLDIRPYLLADNTLVNAQMVRIDGLVIGDYTVDNVVVAIFDNGALLCGKSLLDKFKKWEFDGESKTLILYK